MAGVCLNMIVKNEAAILERCLASVAPFVDHYVIADTGSKDGTPDLIRDFFTPRGIPGEIVHVPFKNFEQARNAALINPSPTLVLGIDENLIPGIDLFDGGDGAARVRWSGVITIIMTQLPP